MKSYINQTQTIPANEHIASMHCSCNSCKRFFHFISSSDEIADEEQTNKSLSDSKKDE